MSHKPENNPNKNLTWIAFDNTAKDALIYNFAVCFRLEEIANEYPEGSKDIKNKIAFIELANREIISQKFSNAEGRFTEAEYKEKCDVIFNAGRQEGEKLFKGQSTRSENIKKAASEVRESIKNRDVDKTLSVEWLSIPEKKRGELVEQKIALEKVKGQCDLILDCEADFEKGYFNKIKDDLATKFQAMNKTHLKNVLDSIGVKKDDLLSKIILKFEDSQPDYELIKQADPELLNKMNIQDKKFNVVLDAIRQEAKKQQNSGQNLSGGR